MQLVTFSIEGYRRFVLPTSLKLHNDLIAFVGPNEAGKSSILKAIQHLNSDAPFESNELPRRSSATPLLKWQFQLQPSDKAALAGLSDAAHVERIAIIKGADAVRRWEFFPPVSRDRTPRQALSALAKAKADRLQTTANEYGIGLDTESLIEALESDVEYDDQTLSLLSAHSTALSEFFVQIPGDELDSTVKKDVKSITQLLAELIQSEQLPHPTRLARAALEPAVPQVKMFDVEDRDLRKEYDLNEDADNPPRALSHLADLGQLSLTALRDEIASGSIADASTRRNSANRNLKEAFRAWNQESIALQVDFQGSLLHIQVTTPADDGLSSIDERSEGMRWFATLLAFTSGAGNHPILLADEIETHLHYDAQADLVEVLSNQDLVSKVIYTTHSFGCLPNDLGNGVRVIEQVDIGTSTTKNGFWENGSGFSPLLVSMGAAAVTFTPTRKALIGEGATEAIVLPTILRQATENSKLDFQIAPGLSSVAAADVPALGTEAGQVAYIVDGDPGGLKIVQKLSPHVESARIVVLSEPDTGTPMETEDLIDATIYAEAVNEELHLWNSISATFEAHDLSPTMRTKSVETWCRRRHISPPDKAAVAQRVANRSADTTVFEPTRQQFLIDLLARIEAALIAQ